MNKEYSSLAKYYDLLHTHKTYFKDVEVFSNLILQYKTSPGNRLLDVACGTGEHIFYFKKKFNCDGIDLSSELIDIASNKNPECTFKVANMINYSTPGRYDVLTCLFSSIAYLHDQEELQQTIGNFHKNLIVGGVLLIETLFLKNILNDMQNHIREYSDEHCYIKRITDIHIDGDKAFAETHYQILADGCADINLSDKHVLHLSDKNELARLIENIGFKVKIIRYETGTYLFICTKK